MYLKTDSLGNNEIMDGELPEIHPQPIKKTLKDVCTLFIATVQQYFWKQPLPILIDANSSREQSQAGRTVQGWPYKDVVSALENSGKVRLVTKGSRLFIINKKPWAYVAESPR